MTRISAKSPLQSYTFPSAAGRDFAKGSGPIQQKGAGDNSSLSNEARDASAAGNLPSLLAGLQDWGGAGGSGNSAAGAGPISASSIIPTP